VLNSANGITSSTGINGNFNAASFLQLNATSAVNRIAADKSSVDDTQAFSNYIQPMQKITIIENGF
jgi:hypothetical protein